MCTCCRMAAACFRVAIPSRWPLTPHAGSCDSTAKMWILERNQSGVVAQVGAGARGKLLIVFWLQHSAPIKECAFIGEAGFLVTGSWDKTLKYWDVRTQVCHRCSLEQQLLRRLN